MLKVVGLLGTRARPFAIVTGLTCRMLGLAAATAHAEPNLSDGARSEPNIVVAGMRVRMVPKVRSQGSESAASEAPAPGGSEQAATANASPDPANSSVDGQEPGKAAGEQPAIAASPAPDTGVPRKSSVRAKADTGPKGLREDDYYVKRAKSLLVEDQAAQNKERSLQVAYPGFNVIVCEAGCYGTARKLVHFEPIRITNAAGRTASMAAAGSPETTVAASSSAAPTTPADASGQNFGPNPPGNSAGQMQPTAATMGGGESSQPAPAEEIGCVAGCYGNLKARSYPAASRGAAADAARAELERITARREALADAARKQAEDSWLTTVAKPADAKKPASASRPKARGARSASGQRRQSAPSGEWFKRINDERSGAVR